MALWETLLDGSELHNEIFGCASRLPALAPNPADHADHAGLVYWLEVSALFLRSCTR